MRPNDKVEVTVYGRVKTGTIQDVGHNGSIVFVTMDESGLTNWFHRESLTVKE